MKKLILFVVSVAVILGCSRKENVLKICAISDVHGCYFDSTLVSSQQTKASLSRISAYLKELRSTTKGVVLIDNGDNLQGELGAYYYNYVNTEIPHIYGKIAEYLDYDAIIVGNHDIEAGHGTYDRVRVQYSQPFLAANALKEDGSCYFERYTVVKVAGKKVAIIGFTNPNIRNWLSEDLFRGMDFVAPQEIAQELVDEVRTVEKPDYVVVSMHTGTGSGEEDSFENAALFLAKTLVGVDVVIAGHDHRPYAVKCENGTILVNPGSRAYQFGVVTIPLGGGERTFEIVDMEGKPSDAEFNAYFAEDFATVRAFAGQKVCELKGEIDLADAVNGPNAYVSLIHKAQLKAMGAQISFAAPLGRRNVIKEGDLCYEDLLKIYPYENQLYAIELTGRQIKDYLEFSYDNWINKKGPAYNYDSAAGINYKVYVKNPKGKRVVITSLAGAKGEKFSLNKTYTVAMTSYRASGGGYLLRDGAGVDPAKSSDYIVAKGGFVRDYIFDYLKEQGVYRPEVLRNWSFVK